MAVPGSGSLSLGKIRQELQTNNYAAGPYTAAATSLDDAENGTIATINTCSAVYPLSANPANMSEWYAYDHDAGCPCFGNSFSLDVVTNFISALTGSNKWDSEVGGTRVVVDQPLTFNWWVKNVDTSPLGNMVQYFGVTGNATYNGVGSRRSGLQLAGYSGAGVSQLGFNFNVIDNNNTVEYSVASLVHLTSGSNGDLTGVGSSFDWDVNNPGSTNANDFSQLTLVYDPNNSGNQDLVKWYWNGRRLSCLYKNPIDPLLESWTNEYVGGPPGAMVWGDNACASMGSNLFACSGSSAELGSHQLIDEFSVWAVTALAESDIEALYDGLEYQTVPGGVKTLCVGEMGTNLAAGAPDLHYAFETGSTLGYPYAGTYTLGHFGTPLRSSDNA